MTDGDIVFFKGSLLGGIVGFSITLWLNMGSLTARRMHHTLPPVSTENCSLGNSNSTILHSSLNYANYTSVTIFDGLDARDNWNQTSDGRGPAVVSNFYVNAV